MFQDTSDRIEPAYIGFTMVSTDKVSDMILKGFTYAMIAVFTGGMASIAVTSTGMLMSF